jgi:putative hydrolase of the HAD superfamily
VSRAGHGAVQHEATARCRAAVVVLDIDDTLYLERDYVRSGFDVVGRLVSERLGVDGLADTLWAGFLDGVRGDAFDKALELHGLHVDAALVAELVHAYRSHRPCIRLLPDAVRLLDRLDGRRVGAITDGPVDSQRAKVDALGLTARLDPLVVTGELGPGRGKPHPAAFEVVERVTGATGAELVYVADNPAKDFITPLQRGWRAVRVRRPGSLHEPVGTPDGVGQICSLDQLLV